MEDCLYNKAYLNGFIGQFWKYTWAKYKKDPNAKFYKQKELVKLKNQIRAGLAKLSKEVGNND